MNQPIVIFVLGMHRSGTSALAGALAEGGVWMGNDLLEPEVGVNEKGFWEHRELVRLNEALFEKADCRWFTVWAGARLKAFYHDKRNVAPVLLRDAWNFARQLVEGRAVVAIKDPRLCLLADFWRGVFEAIGAKVVAFNLVRHPKEVTSSLAQRDGLAESHSRALWIDYVSHAYTFSASLPFAFSGLFDDLMAGSDAFVTRALAQLGLSNLIDYPPSGEVVDPALRHHRAPAEEPEGLLAEKALRIYEAVADGREPEIPELDLCTRSAIEELQSLFERYNQTVIKAQQSAAELLRLGRLHEHALAVVAERDFQLNERNAEFERLGQLHSHALEVIGQKDKLLTKREAEIHRLEKGLLRRLYRLAARLRRKRA